ncbi:hypothetical protein SAMN05216436_1188 [bacterium A37T11]|nr:hypothetical protein SAMN05216436_1188 [bacterium A37T11]
MNNIKKVNPFQATIIETSLGTLTTLTTEAGISAHECISYGEKMLLANYIYHKDENYDLVYSIMDPEGGVESFVEHDGILPTLFLSPTQQNYVSLQPYHPDKNLEISIPVFNRENTALPKGNRPFSGKFVGTINQFSIFYEVDNFSDTKPDKLLAIEFKNGTIKKKHLIKIGFPKNNKISIKDNEIHLLAKNVNGLTHRQIDEFGNVKKERQLLTKQNFYREILKLSFESTSNILCEENGKISIKSISVHGEIKEVPLFDLKEKLYNTWAPERIAEDTFVTRFNGEFGNGWFTTKEDNLLELFYNKDVAGYKNMLTNEVFPMDHQDLIISGINKTSENNYAVVLYPRPDQKSRNKKLIVLNRKLG